jgi:hypothetical protein
VSFPRGSANSFLRVGERPKFSSWIYKKGNKKPFFKSIIPVKPE